MEGLKTLKPQQQHKGVVPSNGHKERVEPHGGVDLEADIVLSEDDGVNGVINWVVESLKFSVKHPVILLVAIISSLYNQEHISILMMGG